MCLTLSTWKVVDQMRWQSAIEMIQVWYTSALESPNCNAVLSSNYPIHRSVSKVNCSGADTRVVSFHFYPAVFHPFVEQ